jgi:hypothetical protein
VRSCARLFNGGLPVSLYRAMNPLSGH